MTNIYCIVKNAERKALKKKSLKEDKKDETKILNKSIILKKEK